MSLHRYGDMLRVTVLILVLTPWPAAFAAAPTPPAAVAPAPTAAPQKAPAPPTAEQKRAQPQAPVSIPIPEIAKQAEEAAKLLRDIEALAAPTPAIDTIQAGLPAVSDQLGPALQATSDVLGGEPTLPIVERIALSWQVRRVELTGWVETLTKRATQLETALEQLTALRTTWTQTRSAAQTSRAPLTVVQRVDDVLADIEKTRGHVQMQRAGTLVLQDTVGKELARCQDALDRIAEYRRGGRMRMFVRSTAPIWSAEIRAGQLQELAHRAREAAAASLMVLSDFADAHEDRLILQGLLFVAVVVVALAARRQQRAGAATSEGALPTTALRTCPLSAAAVVALTSMTWLYPERPQTLLDVTAMLLVLPVVRIVRPYVAPPVAPALYGFGGLFLVDRARAELAVIPLADQALLLIAMLTAMTGLTWLLASGRLRESPAWGPVLAVLALLLCATSFAAGAHGMLRLGRTLGAGVLVGLFMALVAYSAVQVTVGLAGFAMRAWPLKSLGMVLRHEDLLARRLRHLIGACATVAWIAGTLRFHGLLDTALTLGHSVLVTELRRGTIAISLGDVVAFVITIWLAYLLSGVIRFVLQEDVYPHLQLAPGLSYVVSSLLNYAILFVGFLLAVGALGVDLNKVTVLAGAFGVGLGFGLQNVVNNFVSGLVVLFERPIRVGDAIQMTDVAGQVRRIGMRSTTVHTWDGADVIVPNAALLAEKVTNWTLSDRQRRMDVAVGVAYGTAPDKVLEILLTVARAHPYVLSAPAAEAFFLGFGESALKFELRAWTGRFDRCGAIQSELAVAVYSALCDARIEIPFPQREVRLRERDGVTNPPR